MYDLTKTGPVPSDLASRTLFSKVLVPMARLWDAQVESGVRTLNGLRFTDCVIRGPVVLIPAVRTNFMNCNLGDVDGDVRNLFLEAAGPKIIGGVSVDGVTFEGCLFVGVGFAGDRRFIDELSRSLSGAGDAASQ